MTDEFPKVGDMLRLSFLPADTGGHVRVVADINVDKLMISFVYPGKNPWICVTPFSDRLSCCGRTVVWVREDGTELYSIWLFPGE